MILEAGNSVMTARARRRVLLAGLLPVLAACAGEPFAPPPVTAGFVTPEVFHLSVNLGEDAQAPMMRNVFHAEVENFARASGCTGYRVLREIFTTSTNVNARVSTEPSLVFGRRPGYHGVVECRLPPSLEEVSKGLATASPQPRPPVSLVP